VRCFAASATNTSSKKTNILLVRKFLRGLTEGGVELPGGVCGCKPRPGQPNLDWQILIAYDE
jgi:hypothetical protein